MALLGNFVRRHFEPLMLLVQVLVDALVVLIACIVGYLLGERIIQIGDAPVPEWQRYRELWALITAFCLVSFHAFGMYRPVKSLLNVEEFAGLLKAVVVAFLALFTAIVFLRRTTQDPEGPLYGLLVPLHQWVELDLDVRELSRVTLLLTFALILAMTTVSRFISFKFLQGLYRRGIGNRNVLILGVGETGRWLQRKFLVVPTLGLRLVGFVSDGPQERGGTIDRSPVLGSFDEIDELVRRYKVHEVFVALPESSEERVMEVIDRLDRLGVIYRVVPRFYHLMSQRVRIENLDSIPLISRPVRRERWVTRIVKRAMDLVIASIALLLGLPLFVLAAVMIKRESEGPVFYRQMRIGKDGRPFKMFKFRTMYTHMSGDAPAPSTAHDPRITGVGRFLRRYSLDEIPQLLNVLKGDMSIVGPRPEMPFIVERYTPISRERLRAKPGITGLWQISYAREEAIHENIDYDLYYIENQSVLLDVVIMALTFVAVIKGTGAH